MPIYRMADLIVKIEPRFDRVRKYAEKYLYTGDIPDNVVDLSLSDEFIIQKHEENPHLSLEDIEYVWTGAKFSANLLKHNGFVLHSSAVAYDGNAYVFSADSGTGKSTHTRFWQKVFGEDQAVIINDDKPALRKINGRFCACGTAFSGKSPTSADVQVPIKAVCFIYRSEKNEIRRLDPPEALKLIFEQTMRKGNSELVGGLLTVLDEFLREVPCYSLGVTLSEDSARFAYESIGNSIDKNCILYRV